MLNSDVYALSLPPETVMSARSEIGSTEDKIMFFTSAGVRVGLSE